MAKPRKGSWDREFEEVDPAILKQSVIEVVAMYEADERQPGSGFWEYEVSGRRQNMIDDVRARYRELSGYTETFPFHDDYIAKQWVKYRKQGG